jgi:hypothetical protein
MRFRIVDATCGLQRHHRHTCNCVLQTLGWINAMVDSAIEGVDSKESETWGL